MSAETSSEEILMTVGFCDTQKKLQVQTYQKSV